MTMHRVRASDTIVALAARYLGDAARWREIAAANELRAPYIADDPFAQFGPRLAVFVLDNVVEVGQRLIALPGADQTLVRPGVRVVLSRRDELGGLTVDAHLASDYDGNVVTIADPLAASYPAGAAVEVYVPPGEVPGRVAQPGEVLLIPDGAESVAPGEVAGEADRYGRDLACDAAGNLRATSSGDLVLSAGGENLVQQLRNRLQTPRGALYRHPLYGCDMHQYVGQAAAPTLAILVQAAVAQALADDPRVARVHAVHIAQRLDVIEAAVAVEARNERVALTVEVSAL